MTRDQDKAMFLVKKGMRGSRWTQSTRHSSDLSRPEQAEDTGALPPIPPNILVCVGTINQEPARYLWSQVV